MFATPLKALGHWHRNESGAVLPMFGLTSLILLLSAGLAIDFGMAHQAKTKLGDAADAAVLATAKAVREQNLNQTQAETLIQQFFQANMGAANQSFAVVTNFKPNINLNTGSVQLDVRAKVDTIFGSIIGIDFWNVPVVSVALIEGKDIEIGLQLDVTGSMNDPAQGNSGPSKLSELKVAAKDLIDIVISDNLKSQKVKVGIAPFSGGVNAGSVAKSVNGNRNDTCVYERQSESYQASDVAPTGSASLKIKADLPGADKGCSSSTVTPLTEDKSTLKSAIDGLVGNGFTAGHLGTAWAWYLVAPEWASVWTGDAKPQPYNDGKTIKVAILMTDGAYNTFGGVTNSNTDEDSGDAAKATCAAMKAKKITLYTVGFGTGAQSGNAKDILSNCATDSDKFYLAKDGDALRAAFRSIAQDITTLRLTR